MRTRSLILLAAFAGCTIDAEVFESITDAGTADAGSRDAGIPPVDPTLRGVSAFAARSQNTAAIVQGRIYAAGNNDQGQLGAVVERSAFFVAIGEDDDWEDITGGDDFLCAKKRDGRVLCWGGNARGQLGTGDTMPRDEPTASKIDSVRSVAATRNHVCAVRTDGTLWCWGANAESQLGQPNDRVDRSTPVMVGVETDWRMVAPGQGHTCGIREPGTLWCWGRNSEGECAKDPANGVQLIRPTQVGDREDWRAVGSGQHYTCAIDGLAKLWCWGENTFGQMGVEGLVETFEPARVGDEQDWIDLTVDTFASCGVHADGRLECWGRNAEGQLGIAGGDRASPTLVDTASTARTARVGAGRFHTCLLDVQGVLACTGENGDGRLGVGDFASRRMFTPSRR